MDHNLVHASIRGESNKTSYATSRRVVSLADIVEWVFAKVRHSPSYIVSSDKGAHPRLAPIADPP